MTDPLRTAPPAGWYPDPQGLPQQRWWTGSQWTHDTSPHAPVPVPVRPAVTDAPAMAPSTTPYVVERPVTYTPSVVSPAAPPAAFATPADAPIAFPPVAPVPPSQPVEQFALPATPSSDAFPTRRQLRERAQALAAQQAEFEPHTLSPFAMPAAEPEPAHAVTPPPAAAPTASASTPAGPATPVPLAPAPFAAVAPTSQSPQTLLPSPPMSAAALFPERHGTPVSQSPSAEPPASATQTAPAQPLALTAAPSAPAGPFSAARAASASPSFSSTVAQLAPAQPTETPASWPFQPAASDAVPYQPFGMIPKLGSGSRDVPQTIYTVAGWLIAALPLVVGLIFAAVLAYAPDSYSRFVQVGILLVFVLASLGLAMRDRRGLQAAGFDATASPAWTLATPLVYLIVRSVAVQREAKRSGILVLVWIVLAAAVGAAAYFLATPETLALLLSPATLY